MIDLKNITRDETNSSLVVLDEAEYNAAITSKKARQKQIEEQINNSNRILSLESDMKSLKDDIAIIKELLLKGLK